MRVRLALSLAVLLGAGELLLSSGCVVEWLDVACYVIALLLLGCRASLAHLLSAAATTPGAFYSLSFLCRQRSCDITLSIVCWCVSDW